MDYWGGGGGGGKGYVGPLSQIIGGGGAAPHAPPLPTPMSYFPVKNTLSEAQVQETILKIQSTPDISKLKYISNY